MQHKKLFKNIITILVLLLIRTEVLLVPVIKHADRKSIFAISDEINALAVKARDGKLAPAEMKGASCSITNIGSAGGQWFTPIINHPEVAILGIGRIAEKPVIKNGEIVAAPMLALSLSLRSSNDRWCNCSTCVESH